MKTQFFVFTTLILLVSLVHCKKEDEVDSSNPPNNNTTVPPAIVPPSSPGFISCVHVLNLTFDLSGSNPTGQINAVLYEGSGSIVSNQPNFIYSADDNQIATVDASGIVTGLQLGSTIVSVTDNIHGIQYVAVTVTDSIFDLSQPFSVTFNPVFLAVDLNGTATFNFTAYNVKGEVVSPNVTFFSTSPGFSVNSNSVTSTSEGGTEIKVLGPSLDTINGILSVYSYNAQDPLYWCDTIITDLILDFYPYLFSRPGVTALPVRITVVELYTSCSTTVSGTYNSYQTSPDQIILYGNKIRLNALGLIESVTPGVNFGFEISYKGKGKSFEHLTMRVYNSLQGKWEGNIAHQSLLDLTNWPYRALYASESSTLLPNLMIKGKECSANCGEMDIKIYPQFGTATFNGGSAYTAYPICPDPPNFPDPSIQLIQINDTTISTIEYGPGGPLQGEYNLNSSAICGSINNFLSWTVDGMNFVAADTSLLSHYFLFNQFNAYFTNNGEVLRLRIADTLIGTYDACETNNFIDCYTSADWWIIHNLMCTDPVLPNHASGAINIVEIVYNNIDSLGYRTGYISGNFSGNSVSWNDSLLYPISGEFVLPVRASQ